MVSYPDLIPRNQVRIYLKKRTGTLVTEYRITRWITKGELRTVAVPYHGGHKWYVTRQSLEALIARYSG